MFTITVTRTYYKPTPEALYYKPKQEYLDYLKKNYIDTGKCTAMKHVTSEDGLVGTTTVHWINEQALAEFRADPMMITIMNERTMYYQSQGIIESEPVITSFANSIV